MSDSKKHKIFLLPENHFISSDTGQSFIEALNRAGILLQSDCGGSGRCGKCQVRIIDAEEKADYRPDEAEQRLIARQDLRHGIRLACRLKIKSDLTAEIPADSRFIPEVVAKPATHELISKALAARKPASVPSEGYGLAVDLGTTTIGIYLCNLAQKKVVVSIAVRNPQAMLGADVITRISAVMQDPRNLPRLQQMSVGAIKAAIRSICATTHINPGKISQMIVVGNSSMIHLVLGEDPSSIGVSPYQPKFTRERNVEAHDVGLNFNPTMKIYSPPLISGFLGSDILSAAFATRFFDTPPGTLLVDMGTNGELMLKGNKGIIATSCATGPAFEGSNIHNGMQAAPGAVDAVRLDKHSGEIELSIIQRDRGRTVKPSGICGSGIVSIVAELIRSGVVLGSGAFNPECKYPGLRFDNMRPTEFIIASGQSTATGRELTIIQKDIRAIQLAKSALSSGIQLICEKAGIKRPKNILLAGAFGNYLDLEDCCTIGLLAGVHSQDIKVVGNAAGAGAVLMMYDETSGAELKKLVRLVKIFNLSANSEFQDTFIKNLNFQIGFK